MNIHAFPKTAIKRQARRDRRRAQATFAFKDSVSAWPIPATDTDLQLSFSNFRAYSAFKLILRQVSGFGLKTPRGKCKIF
jgi:hypothetical protein